MICARGLCMRLWQPHSEQSPARWPLLRVHHRCRLSAISIQGCTLSIATAFCLAADDSCSYGLETRGQGDMRRQRTCFCGIGFQCCSECAAYCAAISCHTAASRRQTGSPLRRTVLYYELLSAQAVSWLPIGTPWLTFEPSRVAFRRELLCTLHCQLTVRDVA